MNRYHPAIAVVVLCCFVGLKAVAAGSSNLESNVYVYRNSDFNTVKIPSGASPNQIGGIVLGSPATIEFDQEMLRLGGDDFAWSGGDNPPNRFSLIAAPTAQLTTDKRVTLLSTAPVQYLEKAGDGTLLIREIAADSPDAPHCRLTFTMGAATDTPADLLLICEVDVATIRARESVPGVTLDVGKPVLARFQERIEFVVRLQEWSALLLQAPNGSDYSLLVLVKVVPAKSSHASGAAAQEAQLMTAAELDEFVTGYYQNPQPELIARAIEAFGPSGFVKDRAQVYVGFFAEVFAANPGRRVEWRKVMDRQDRPTREVLKQARRLSRPGALLASEGQSVAVNDRYWGAFFASGNSDYLRKLIDNLRYVDDEQPPLFWTGATAMWSLARNGPAHPLVKVMLETAQDKTDHSRTREIIGEVLTWNLDTMREKILERGRDLKFADPTRVGHPWSLHDRSGFVGPAAGQPPPKSIWGNR